jgi:hypothetical protein
VVWRGYLDFGNADPLLLTCWLVMLVLMVSRVDAGRDTRVAIVALAGGAFIEAWGTRAGLWTYFTLEKPPLFILLAWPPATLATERLARLAEAASAVLVGRREIWRYAWIVIVGGFVAYLAWWARPGYGHPLTWLAGAAIATVLVTRGDHRVDVCRFVAGAALGYLLERWGTTRACWTYWSGGTPPLVAVLAHGFAAIAFLRTVDVWQRAARRWTGGPAARRWRRGPVAGAAGGSPGPVDQDAVSSGA